MSRVVAAASLGGMTTTTAPTSSYSPGSGYARDVEYERLERQAALSFPREFELMIAHGLTRTGTVIDLGSGNGAVTRRLREELPDATVYGSDVDAELLASVEPPTLAIVDGTIPVPDGSVDDIVMRFVAQHLRPALRAEVFAEIRRVLRPGGRLHVIDVDDSDAGHSSGRVTRGLVELFSELRAIQSADGGDRQVVKKIPAELERAGFIDVDPVTSAVTTNDHPVAAFSVHMGPDRYVPLVAAGVLTIEQLAVVGWSWENFRRDPEAFISINIHTVHAVSPGPATTTHHGS